MIGMRSGERIALGNRRRSSKRGFAVLLCIATAACGGSSHDATPVVPSPSPTTVPQPSPTARPTPTPHVAAGELDTGFGNDGVAILDDVNGLRVPQRGLFTFADGRMVLLAFEGDANDVATELVRFEIAADGRGDDLGASSTASRPLPSLVPVAAAVTANGGAIVLGRPAGETEHLVATRLTPEGDLDATFGDAGLSTIDLDYGAIVLPLPDGRTVIAGEVQPSSQALMRLAPDGSIDRSFGRDGLAALPIPSETDADEFYLPTDLAVTQDGHVLVAVTDHRSISQNPVLIAFTSTGEIDRAFGDGGIVQYGSLGTGGMLSVGRDGTAYWSARGDLLRVERDGNLTKLARVGGFLVGSALNGNFVLAGSGWVPDEPRRFDCLDKDQGICLRSAIEVQSLTVDGMLDLGFGDDGTTLTDLPPPHGAPYSGGALAIVAAPEDRLTLLAIACARSDRCDHVLLRYGAP